MHRIPVTLIGLAMLLVGLAACQAEASPTASPSPTPSPTPTEEPSPSLAAELLDRRWTILFAGLDANEQREANDEPVNTDALMLVSLSADQSRLTLVSLPRDTVDLPLADGTSYPRKINALYRDQGMDALVGAMETLFGVPIDAHVLLDMDDFTALVDAVGTVEVAPPEPIRDPIVGLDLPAGPQEIDAVTANGYVRTRVDQDYGRMARQQEVLIGIVDRILDPATEVDLSALLAGLESFETDLPLAELTTLFELARRGADADVETLVIGPPLITFQGDRGDGRGYVLEPDVAAIRAEVQRRIGE
jgi:LCP family protein required for cell wall assembly